MYDILWDKETGGILLAEASMDGLRGEVRPVFFEELDLLGFDRYWSYPHQEEPLLWATPGRRYFYRGELVAEAKGGGFFQPPQIEFYIKDLCLEPVAVQAMVARNSTLLQGLIHQAIVFIRSTMKKYQSRVDATTVAFSGGKDSLVLLDLVQRALPPDEFVVVFSDTTMEISATYESVAQARQRWPNLAFYTARAAKDAQTTWREFGPPSRIHRWCCTVHKSAPTILLLRELTGRTSLRVLLFDGVRWEESQLRSRYRIISEGSKHNTQINASPLLKWNAAEVFLYLFQRHIFFNKAYRYGLVRVGCAVCPMASRWWDSISCLTYRNDVNKFIKIIHDYASKKNISPKEIEKFIIEGGWKGRAGGRDLENGGTGVLENLDGKEINFFIRQPREEWLEWAQALGTVIREGPDRGRLISNGFHYPFQLQRHSHGVAVRIEDIHRADRFFLSHLRAVANKTACCNHCRGCEVECPTGALKITDAVRIEAKKCSHCGNCLSFTEKGCLAARSLSISKGGTGVKGLNRYQHFGMRKGWLEEYFRDPENWWHDHTLGNRQFEAMRVWLREAEILEGNKMTPLGAKLKDMGTDNPLTWAVIWTNLARRSALVAWYVNNVPWGESYSKQELIEMLDNSLAQSSRENAITALVGLLRDTPLGKELGLGEVETRGRQTAAITKQGWEQVHPVAILYALYRYAERIGRYGLSLTELLEGAPEGPYVLFGLAADRLAGLLKGLSSRWEDWISVEMLRDLDNIYLNNSRTSIEVLDLA